ncbi:ATPase [Betaproteobacteria bacterium]|nr:ATPase [Betaproteobacteria bacterium]
MILRDARQVGKTWLLCEWGKTSYRDCLYVNFEDTPALQTLFTANFDLARILAALRIHGGIDIVPGETLIIFDEIQSAERGLTALKYLYEKAPEQHIVAAGSLLGMGLHSGISFPVGKVDFMDLRPLSFNEFLRALGDEALADALSVRDWKLLGIFRDKLLEHLRTYYFVGGMPEAVAVFAETRDAAQARHIQLRILDAYEADFSKHAPRDIVPRIRMVWQSIPAQMARENKKFTYGVMRQGARAKDFELAIQWLVDCGLLLKCSRVTQPAMPLIAYQDASAFKLFLNDVGLLAALSRLPLQTLIAGDAMFTEFKGALTEQYVMQQLRLRSDNVIGYWTNDRSTAEVDFVVQRGEEIVPIEVKAGENLKSKSFKFFCEKFSPRTALRASLSDYHEESWMTNVPLYAVGT